MRPGQRTSTTRLPQSLRDQIEAQEASNHDRPHNHRAVSRKEHRKAGRQGAKQRKAQHFSEHAGSLKRPLASSGQLPAAKKRKISLEVDAQTLKDPREKGAGQTPRLLTTISVQSKSSQVPRMAKTKTGPPSPPPGRSKRDEEEDAYIAMLESRLGVTKGGKRKIGYGSAFRDDGLLDLLDDLDLPSMQERSEHAQDLDVQSSEDTDETFEGDHNSDGEWSGFSAQETSGECKIVPLGVEHHEESLAPGNESKTTASAYVPPHLRRNVDASVEASVPEKLTKQLKGLLNRLSEQNIASVIKDIEHLYREHRRFDVTSSLTSLIIDGTCSHSMLTDAHVALYSGLVACLHKIIGVEFGAFVVQEVIKLYEQHYPRSTDITIMSENAAPGKECSNLLVLLTELYNFQVISCVLIYDLIRSILDGEMSELDVDLVLKIVRNSGNQLRQDDPSALKGIVQIVQTKLSSQEKLPSSRTKFMIESLTNLTNNKVKRQAADGSGSSEIVLRINKFVSSVSKNYHVLAHEPLRVTLEDLHTAESKGKWWLVGSAWGGDPLLERQKAIESASRSSTDDTRTVLLKLARKHGMNTDVRRSIFVVLMSSDDYVDACDRLTQLNLTEVQQREIIRVLLHCCGNEKAYNPYYTLIGQHLSRLSHSHKVTFQFALWDFLRSLGETGIGGSDIAESMSDSESLNSDGAHVSPRRMTNYAKAYAWWIAKDSLSIAILKPIEFLTAKPKTREFLKILFSEIFHATQSNSMISVGTTNSDAVFDRSPLEAVMLKTVRLPGLAKGIIYFMTAAFGRAEDTNASSAIVAWGSISTTSILRSALETAI